MKQNVIFEGDNAFLEIKYLGEDSIGSVWKTERQLIMTKDVFIQCYEKWIKGEKDAKID